MKNEKGETPYGLFAMEHEDLRKEGEKWMMNTAKSSMVVATLINQSNPIQPMHVFSIYTCYGLGYVENFLTGQCLVGLKKPAYWLNTLVCSLARPIKRRIGNIGKARRGHGLLSVLQFSTIYIVFK